MTATSPYSLGDDESRWDALVRRDRAAGTSFVYSVRTTGVYCRPNCPAKLPKRENVRFHATCGEAERAGFRPCKRCRPTEPPLAERHLDAVVRACRVIESTVAEKSLSELSHSAGMSAYHFHRVFKMIVGITPKAYAAAHRSDSVRDELTRSPSVAEAVYRAGFNSGGRFYATVSERLGMTPTDYRAGGVGIAIRFAIGACSLGSVLVAASETGICSIFLGDDPNALVLDLQNRFPNARITGGDAKFDHWVAAVVGLVERPALALDLPLDIRGTAFQVRVWKALQHIPLGSTASYAEIAARIGQPGAVRAVGQACGANPIAVAIPCHRVVRTDGALSGYRWGVERKAELLHREQPEA